MDLLYTAEAGFYKAKLTINSVPFKYLFITKKGAQNIRTDENLNRTKAVAAR
jgi:hypothetical protein